MKAKRKEGWQDMDLNSEIDAVVARLNAGKDPRPILTAFARSVRGAGRVVVERTVFKCVICRNVDVPCFQCKALSVVGERGMAAMPTLLPKLSELATKWAADRKAKKELREAEEDAAQAAAQAARRAQQEQARRRPPPPAGQHRF